MTYKVHHARGRGLYQPPKEIDYPDITENCAFACGKGHLFHNLRQKFNKNWFFRKMNREILPHAVFEMNFSGWKYQSEGAVSCVL